MKLSLVLLGLVALFVACEAAVTVNITAAGTRFALPTPLFGPESFEVDAEGLVYMSVADGSIQVFNPTTNAFSLYAYTNPTLTNRTNCGVATIPSAELVCGRPLGIKFDKNYNMYVCDASLGLLRIDRATKAVQVLTTSSQGLNISFANALLINSAQDAIYFTDTSPVDRRTQFVKVFVQALPNGRLLKYNITTGETSTLLSGLVFGNGIAFTTNEEAIVINETSLKRMLRYYLTGTRAGTSDTFVADLSGYPDNVEFDSASNLFLVGCYGRSNSVIDGILSNATERNYYSTQVPPPVVLGLIPLRGWIQVVNQAGQIVATLDDVNGTTIARVAEAKRIGNSIYVGSVLNNFFVRFDASVLANIGTTTGATSSAVTTSTSDAASLFPQLALALVAVLLAMM